MVNQGYEVLAQRVIDRLRGAGLTVHAQSRFAKYQSMFLNLKARPGNAKVSAETQDGLAEGIRDLLQMQFIVEKLLGPAASSLKQLDRSVLDEKLATALRGAVTAPSGKDDPARNAQWELYVLSISAAAGFGGLGFIKGEKDRKLPDHRFQFEGADHSVEAKRLVGTGEHGFRNRLKEAIKQVESLGIPGIVAMDIGVSINPNKKRFAAVLSDQLAGEQRLQDFAEVARKEEIRGELEGKPNTLLLMTHETQVWRNVAGEWGSQNNVLFFFDSLIGDERKAMLRKLIPVWISGVPGANAGGLRHLSGPDSPNQSIKEQEEDEPT